MSSSSLLREKLLLARPPPPSTGGDAGASDAGVASPPSPGSGRLMELMKQAGAPASPSSGPEGTAESATPTSAPRSSLLQKLAAAAPPPTSGSAGSGSPAPATSAVVADEGSGGTASSVVLPPLRRTSSSADDGLVFPLSPLNSPTSAGATTAPATAAASPLMRKLAGSSAPPPGGNVLTTSSPSLPTAYSASGGGLSMHRIANGSTPPPVTATAEGSSGISPTPSTESMMPTSPPMGRPSLPRFVPLNRTMSTTSSLRATALASSQSLVDSQEGLHESSGGHGTAQLSSSSGDGHATSVGLDSAQSPLGSGPPTGGPSSGGSGKSSNGGGGTSYGRRMGQRPVSMYGNMLDREDSLADLLKEAGDQYSRAFALACKKLSTANKQLIVVAKHSSSPASGPLAKEKKKDKRKDSVSLQNLGVQLGQAREMLESANQVLDGDLRKLTATFEDAGVGTVVLSLGNTCRATTFLINSCKALVLEKPEQNDLYKQVLTATRTIRDAMGFCADTLGQAPAYLMNDAVLKQIQAAVRTVKQSLAQLVMTQAQQTGEHLIPGFRRCELLSAITASVVSGARLLWLRAHNQDEAVAEMATVCATSISQLVTCLQEAANSDVMLTQPQYQDLLSAEWCQQLKDAFVKLVDETRNTLGVPSNTASEDWLRSSEAYDQLLSVLVLIQASVEVMSTLEPAKLVADMEPIQISPSQLDQAEKALNLVMPKFPIPPPSDPSSSSSSTNATTSNPSSSSSSSGVHIWEEPPDGPDNIVLTNDGRLRAATLNKIIERLTMANPPADIVNLVKTFVTTYRSMATPTEVLKRLIERWDVPAEYETEAVPIRLRIVNLLRSWVESNFQDFSMEDIAKLRDFVDSKLMASPSHQKFGQIISEFIKRKLMSHVDDVRATLVELKLEPKIPLSPSKFISVFDEMEIAKQLTLVEFNIYRAIQPVELLSQSWNVEKLKYRAKNVRAMIQRSTSLSMWVASCVLWQPTLKDRARLLTRIIHIAEHLRRFNNFNSLMAIISGLNLSSVRRLKHTWSEISANDLRSFETLEQVMRSDSSFAAYRNCIKNVNPPCVPFLGVYLTDLTFSDDGNPDFVNGLINFSKREQIYTVIQDLLQYQNTPYTLSNNSSTSLRFDYVDHIAAFVKELPQNNDNDLYKLSTQVEPKNSDKASIL